jgi:acyl carrier protein
MTKTGERLIAAAKESRGIVEILPRLQGVAARVFKSARPEVLPESKVTDLAEDSLAVVEFLMNVEDEFGIAISDHKVDEAVTIADWAKLVEESKR